MHGKHLIVSTQHISIPTFVENLNKFRYIHLEDLEKRLIFVWATWISLSIIPHQTIAHLFYLPPSVAESRKWVPYFLIMLSVMAPRLGLLPSCLMVSRNSGSSGKGKPLFSCLSRAKLFTFQRPNSLKCTPHKHTFNGSEG